MQVMYRGLTWTVFLWTRTGPLFTIPGRRVMIVTPCRRTEHTP